MPNHRRFWGCTSPILTCPKNTKAIKTWRYSNVMYGVSSCHHFQRETLLHINQDFFIRKYIPVNWTFKINSVASTLFLIPSLSNKYFMMKYIACDSRTKTTVFLTPTVQFPSRCRGTGPCWRAQVCGAPPATASLVSAPPLASPGSTVTLKKINILLTLLMSLYNRL